MVLNKIQMNKIVTTLVFLLLSSIGFAQSGVVKSTYKAHAEGWLVSIDEAYALSKKTGNPIMANFTGTDWCGWCIKLKAEVFDKPEFKEWAKKNVVLLEVDFPRKKQLPDEIKQQNAGLQQAFQVQGYPTIWVFNMSKDPKTNQYGIEALGKTGYVAGGPANFTKGVDDMIKKGAK